MAKQYTGPHQEHDQKMADRPNHLSNLKQAHDDANNKKPTPTQDGPGDCPMVGGSY